MNNIYGYLYEDVEIIKNINFEYRMHKTKNKVILYDSDFVEKEKDAIILGYINERKHLDSIEDVDDATIFMYEDVEDLDYTDSEESQDFYYIVNKKQGKLSHLIGYIKVDEDMYIGVYKRILFFWWLFIPTVLLLLILLIVVIFISIINIDSSHETDSNKPDKQIADTVKSDGNVTNNDLFIPDTGSIEFAGYDLVYAAEESKIILLENPKVNDVYFTYTITDNNDGKVLLEETDLIPPGTALEWNAWDIVPSGEYTITMHIRTYDMNDTSIMYTPAIMDNVTLKIY